MCKVLSVDKYEVSITAITRGCPNGWDSHTSFPTHQEAQFNQKRRKIKVLIVNSDMPASAKTGWGGVYLTPFPRYPGYTPGREIGHGVHVTDGPERLLAPAPVMVVQ